MPLKIKQDHEASINLTPLIDIVFLLIIFFMVGTKFSELNEVEKNIALQVPSVSSAKALSSGPKKRVINILADGQIVLDQRNVTLMELTSELATAKKQYRKLGVVIRGDKKVELENVAAVMTACRNADINDLNIAVRTAYQFSDKLKAR